MRASHLLAKTYRFNQWNRDRWIEAEARSTPAGARVLDLAAGTCPYRSLFNHCVYEAQDFMRLEPTQLLDGEDYGHIDYACDATAVPVPDGTYDVVLCTEALEHVLDPLAVLREIHRLLKPGGRALLSAPLGSGIHQEPHHYYGGFTPYWYSTQMPLVGFERVDVNPNGGSFSHFGQQAVRAALMSAPWNRRLSLPWWARLAWAPPWLLFAPITAVVGPPLLQLLDRFDTESAFTVGYHVTARKGQE